MWNYLLNLVLSSAARSFIVVDCWLDVELSLPTFRLALAVFIPWRGADGTGTACGMDPR